LAWSKKGPKGVGVISTVTGSELRPERLAEADAVKRRLLSTCNTADRESGFAAPRNQTLCSPESNCGAAFASP
jgi:hypothetical protein